MRFAIAFKPFCRIKIYVNAYRKKYEMLKSGEGFHQ